MSKTILLQQSLGLRFSSSLSGYRSSVMERLPFAGRNLLMAGFECDLGWPSEVGLSGAQVGCTCGAHGSGGGHRSFWPPF